MAEESDKERMNNGKSEEVRKRIGLGGNSLFFFWREDTCFEIENYERGEMQENGDYYTGLDYAEGCRVNER